MTEKCRLTIDQVALMAGVSRSVVSRVLNNHPRVSDDARARVLAVIREHDYRPSSLARSLATDRAFEICVVTPRRRDDALANGFWPLLHLGISEACLERGYFVSLTMISPDTADEIQQRILNDRVFDGYILITQEVTGHVVPLLHARNVPMVLIGHDPSQPDLNSVDVDNFTGAYEAVRHLIELGHRRIACILANMQIQESIERRNGYLKALEDHGIPAGDGLVIVNNYSEKSGYDVMCGWINAGRCPSAVFCASDAIATGVLLALYKARIPVPERVSVVGFDDVPTSAFTAPPLTTIHQPIYRKGATAAGILIDAIEGKATGPVHLRLPAELVVRESTGRFIPTASS